MAKISTNKENEPATENSKKKREEKPATKVVVRRLPPTMTEEQFKMQVSPLPDNDYFYYVPADKSLTPNAFCRAYINFVNQSDLFIFTQKFDGYVFVDSKGGEFPAVVEFAPFQRIPKNRPHRRKDPKTATIESDPLFILFKEHLEAQSQENKAANNASKQHFFESSLIPEKKEANNTPLIDFIKNKRAERQRIRDEKREEKRKKDLERRKAKEEQRRTKKEDETSVVKVLNNQNGSKERVKEKEVKPSFPKRRLDDSKLSKERTGIESRSKDPKIRTGKSYLEERQRQAERREEQRRKLSQSQSTNSISDAKSSEDNANDLNEEKSGEDKLLTDNKSKDTDYKKTDRVFKRDEIKKSSYKYDSKRDREADETRRVRRTTERSHQTIKKDEDRLEDSGRKRYSESRRNHEPTLRDKYKDKDKAKMYTQKKSLNTTSDPEKTKPSADISDKESSINLQDSQTTAELELKTRTTDNIDGNQETMNEIENNMARENQKVEIEQEDSLAKKSKPARRKSLDERNRLSSDSHSSKSYGKEKGTERKRRNSLESSNCYEEDVEHENSQNSKDSDRINNNGGNESFCKDNLVNEIPQKCEFENTITDENNTEEENITRDNYEHKEIPKRRNSTGERQNAEKCSPRRNSLGSEDKNQSRAFKKDQFDSSNKSVEMKSKEEKKCLDGRDPRTERKIRNKDRPSREIYRPGMGKFSKQRMEREKCLGSSTEVDSPSSSPSPTPVLKHKMITPTPH